MSLATEPPCKELDITGNIQELEMHVKNALKGYYEYLDWLKEDSTIAFFGGMTEDNWINLTKWTSDKINAAEAILKNIENIKKEFEVIHDIESYEGDGETEKELFEERLENCFKNNHFCTEENVKEVVNNWKKNHPDDYNALKDVFYDESKW